MRPTGGVTCWAFGCVLYEMLTGTRAFQGEDVADTIAVVLRGQPDWSALPPDLPVPLTVVLRRCLEKDRRKRIGNVATALAVVDETGALTSARSGAPLGRRLLRYGGGRSLRRQPLSSLPRRRGQRCGS